MLYTLQHKLHSEVVQHKGTTEKMMKEDDENEEENIRTFRSANGREVRGGCFALFRRELCRTIVSLCIVFTLGRQFASLVVLQRSE